ncbi:MAG: nuclear transport factor 2 family protein [Flavobacteriaceae bacterium]
MKKLFFLMALSSLSLSAQDSDKEAVQKTIETFFMGFHAQDSLIIKQTVAQGIILQRISQDSAGKTMVRTDDFSKFLKSIVSLPKESKFEEIIKSYNIQIDGPMANAWTPYEFRLKDVFHHCGVNSFQLVKSEGAWKILYLVDTGRSENCD